MFKELVNDLIGILIFSWQDLRVCLETEILWSLLDELIMVIDVFSMIQVLWSDLGCLYVLRNTSWEGMVDKLKL